MTAPASRDGALNVLMSGYCFNLPGHEPAIGVYKRLLRIGLELVRRGHSVHAHVSGRDRYHDPLVEEAERSPAFDFVRLSPHLGNTRDVAERNLAAFRHCVESLPADVVVIGEVPLCGNMLETTVAAGQCGVPVVLVDNAYGPTMARAFAEHHGPAFDGLLLVGPSSHQLRPAPAHIHEAPPFAPSPEDCSPPEAGGTATPAVTVLGYDPAVRELGLRLVAALGPEARPAVVISADPEGTAAMACSLGLPEDAVVTLAPPPERILFGLLAGSRLAVVKGGFMQVTECISLGTPVVAYHYGGSFAVDWLPEISRRAIVSARSQVPTPAVLAGARRHLRSGRVSGAHTGRLGGVVAAADSIERVARAGVRAGTTEDCARMGIEAGPVVAWLRRRFATEDVTLETLRATRIRKSPAFMIFAAVATARIAGVREAPALIIWTFRFEDAAAERWQAMTPEQRYEAHHESAVIVEPWLGEDVLPPRDWDLMKNQFARRSEVGPQR